MGLVPPAGGEAGKLSCAGLRVGPYVIEEEIGRGGMGVVYRARDTKLGRVVAIKALHEILTNDSQIRARLEREARLLAALSHANIATIFAVEEANGRPHLVLEYIPGESLADRLRRGAVTVAAALKLALPVAHALHCAHQRGVIHRDLKPGNIRVTPGGVVKVLDFGLAKVLASEDPLADSGVELTRKGSVVGTPAYMSPEQALGRPVGPLADAWALSCVIYECLTARRLWLGATATARMIAIVQSPVDLSGLPPETPEELRALLTRCLEKDPAKRVQGLDEVAVILEGLAMSKAYR